MRTIRLRIYKLKQSQEGIVSLLVTMVLMIVVSLIALGFAQIARRNQGQELDQQLSTQAFYAAESGVNDTMHIITTAMTADSLSGSQLNRTSCTDPGQDGIYAPLNTPSYSTLNSSNSVEYTCVLVNGSSASIQTDVQSTASEIIPVDPPAASDIASIKLAWSTTIPGDNAAVDHCPTTAVLPTANNYANCGVGVLRVDLVPTGASSAPVSASTLAKETLTFFAVPTPTGTGGTLGTTARPINYDGANSSTSNDDNIFPASCTDATPNCSVTIDIPAADQGTQYTMRVLSEYQESNLIITAENPSGQSLSLSGAQILIDATGRAQGVVRRIQVHVPVGLQSNQLSDYAIESTDSICKRYVVMKPNGSGPGYYASEVAGTGVNTNNTTLNPLCQ